MIHHLQLVGGLFQIIFQFKEKMESIKNQIEDTTNIIKNFIRKYDSLLNNYNSVLSKLIEMQDKINKLNAENRLLKKKLKAAAPIGKNSYR